MTTLSHYLLSHLDGHDLQEELNLIIADVADVGKKISREVQRSGLLDLHGSAGSGTNVHDEEVQKLDERSNGIFRNVLADNEHVVGLASEEEDDIVDVSSGKQHGFLVAFDPLDGSSNIDINASVGTIFSVLPGKKTRVEDFLQPGIKQVAGGYVLYGSSTVLVFTIGKGVHEFTLDPDSGEFLLTGENIKMPDSAKYVSYNEANNKKFKANEARAIQKLFADGASARYIGALVADFHRTLLKGGIFLYPEVAGSDGYKGKLRMQYEVKPLAYLIEQAGGKALVGNVRAMQYHSRDLHERVPFVFGDNKSIEKYVKFK
ncbi:MAG TPA: class 1 fructose-bisphosphatase [Candidatus Saccharimonadales bacterium]|nr:class 1 fructose-bisphosphatase [Candidatus Saccharimonadales bacterium]